VKPTGESHRLLYVNDADTLARIDTTYAVIQEYVPGDGYGFYALYRHGEIRARFMHRRIREYPATGGASTAAESIYDPEICEIGERLLNALHWHGVAMVELKKDVRDGQYTLMEINPKFWGSLDLAAASGVDFAWLSARMAIDGDIERVDDYRLGVRYHWLFPDEILHLASRPSSIGAVLRDTLDAKVHGNVEWRDPLPTLFQIGMTGVKLVSRTMSGGLRRPHGEPRIPQ
jgi:predicted ATP-grasp superfamily ATP-dependent carboligase